MCIKMNKKDKAIEEGRENRENEEGWLPFERKIFFLSPYEQHLITHLISEEIERVSNNDNISVIRKNFLEQTKGHILAGGERCLR